jgi:UrcA family protein
MKYSNSRKYWIATLFCLSCSIPIIASAAIKAPAEDERSTNVSIADLNLVDEQGVEEAYRRLRRASREVCGSQNLSLAGSLKQRQLNQQCYAETLTNAVQDVSNTTLSQLHTSF